MELINFEEEGEDISSERERGKKERERLWQDLVSTFLVTLTASQQPIMTEPSMSP